MYRDVELNKALRVSGMLWIMFVVLMLKETQARAAICLKANETLLKVEVCINYKANAANAVIPITADQWSKKCFEYQKATSCLGTLPPPCNSEQNTQWMLKANFQAICRMTFKDYEPHMHCFKKQNMTANPCYQKLTQQVHDAYDKEMNQQLKDAVCRAFHDYVTCSKMAVEPCGTEAVQLYVNMSMAQVPASFAMMCGLVKEEPPPSVSSHSPHISTSLTVLTLACFLQYVWLFQ